MKIREIHIDGFGQFSGVAYGPFEDPVTVFYGPNEAGKSTLLEFVRRTLFGFPRKNSKVNEYPALAGGSYGGRLVIEDSVASRYNLHRTKGNGYKGRVTLTSGFGGSLPEDELTRLLGSHSQDVFEQVFAFTLDELYSDKLLTDSKVNNQLYVAGMGIASLPTVEDDIEKSRRALFLKGGARQEISIVAGRLEAIASLLREVENNAQHYGELTTRLEQVNSEMEALKEKQGHIDIKRTRRVTIRNALSDWDVLESAERDLASLPVIENFPADGVTRLKTLEERIKTAHEEREASDVARRDAADEFEAGEYIEHEDILKRSGDIGQLQMGRTAFDGSVEDLPKRKIDLQVRQQALDGALQKLGPDWDEERLEQFDLSLSVREEIEQHRERLRAAADELSSRESSLKQANIALEESNAVEIKAKERFDEAEKPSLSDQQLRERRNLISRMRSHLYSLGTAEPTSPGAGSSATVPLVIIIVGIAILIIGAVLGGTALLVGLIVGIAGIALAGVGIYLLTSGRQIPVSRSESSVAGPIHDPRSQVTKDAALLGIETIDESTISALEESVHEEESRLNKLNGLSQALEDARESTKRRRSGVEESEASVNQARGQLEEAQREWRQWLSARGLRETFTPENANELQGQVEIGRQHLKTVREMERRIKAIRKDISEYVEAVQPHAATFEVTFDPNDSSTVATAADSLIALLADVKENVGKRDRANAKLKDAERELDTRKQSVQEAEEELNQLLQSGGANSPEEFGTRAGIVERRTTLTEKARSAEDRLQQISEPGEPFETLKTELANSSPKLINDEIAALEQERAATDDTLNNHATEKGAIESELKRLMGEEESSRLRMERNVLQEQINDHAREWTRLTLARNLLAEARKKFERETQPGVIRHAERFFTKITEGRYRSVYAPLGEQTIRVTDANGGAKLPSQLSRGAREQLFLSLRFGLIRELAEQAEPLPVVVDEILVNFDPDRALRAAVAFMELSDTNQVLVFTCHPTVVELFRNAASEAGREEPAVVTVST